METAQVRFKRFMRFAIAGAAAVITYWITLYTLTEFFGVWYLLSSFFGFLSSQSLGFVLHKFWTFEDNETKRARSQALKYFARGVGLLAANIYFLHLFVERFHINYMKVQMVLTVVLTIVSYVISKKIFAEQKPP